MGGKTSSIRYHKGSVRRAAERALDWAKSAEAALAAFTKASLLPALPEDLVVGFFRRAAVFFLVPSPSAAFFFLEDEK